MSVAFEEAQARCPLPGFGPLARLLVRRAGALQDASGRAEQESGGPPVKVMIVDDDPVAVLVASGLLEAIGHTVTSKLGALGTAVVVLRERPDVVLLDIDMPGLPGTGLIKVIRSIAGHRPAVLLYSGRSADELELAAKEFDADGFICKDADASVLRGRIEQALIAHAPKPRRRE
jgi:CheY-like chemotaxis protein